MSSWTSPTGSDWQSTDPSSTSSCGTGSQPSDGEWAIVFLVRDAAVAAAADSSDEQAAGALSVAESAARKRGRRRKEEKVAADLSDVGAAASWAEKKYAARERRRRRRRKSAAAPCDAPQQQAPAAAAETTSKTSFDVGDVARPFLTIGWAEACSLLSTSSTPPPVCARAARRPQTRECLQARPRARRTQAAGCRPERRLEAPRSR